MSSDSEFSSTTDYDNEPATVNKFPWWERDLDPTVIPEPVKGFFVEVNRLDELSNQEIVEKFEGLIKSWHCRAVLLVLTIWRLRKNEIKALLDLEGELDFLAEGMSYQGIRFVVSIGLGFNPMWKDFCSLTLLTSNSRCSGIYMALIGATKEWIPEIEGKIAVWLHLGAANKNNARKRIEDLLTNNSSKTAEMMGNRLQNQFVPTDGTDIIGLATLLVDSESENIKKWELSEQEVISRSFVGELLLTVVLGCSDKVTEKQLKDREKRLAMLKPGNVEFGGRGGPYEDTDRRSRYEKKEENRWFRTLLFDVDLIFGSTVEIVKDSSRCVLRLVLEEDSTPPEQGLRGGERLFDMDLKRTTALANGDRGKFKYTDDGFCLRIENQEWKWERTDETEEMETDEDEDEEGEESRGNIWTAGGKKAMKVTWDRIAGHLNPSDEGDEEDDGEESDEPDNPNDKTYHGRR
ncbi:hypothetical protein JCM3765_007767 [Sporobolomyces pararoseus]